MLIVQHQVRKQIKIQNKDDYNGTYDPLFLFTLYIHLIIFNSM